VFIGYSIDQAGYRCLHPTRKIYVSRHVEFNPLEFPYSSLFLSSGAGVSSMPSSSGPSTEMFQFLPFSYSNVPRVSQSLVSPLPAAVSKNSGVSLPENSVRSHDHLFPTSSSQFIPPSISKVPK